MIPSNFRASAVGLGRKQAWGCDFNVSAIVLTFENLMLFEEAVSLDRSRLRTIALTAL